MAFDKNQFDDIIQEFTVSGEQLHEIAADFRYDLVKDIFIRYKNLKRIYGYRSS